MDFKEYGEQLGGLYASQGMALTLRPGATIAALDLAEAKLGFALDKDLRSAWLHADGGDTWRPVFMRPGYLTGYDFRSVEEALQDRKS